MRKVWVEGKTALGTEEGQKKRRFHHSHQVKVICPRSRQYNLKTGRELTAKKYQHKSTLCPQYNYHLHPTPLFENPLRRETLRQLNGFLLVRCWFLVYDWNFGRELIFASSISGSTIKRFNLLVKRVDVS